MKIPQMITAELRRLISTRMALIALVALLVVPIVYAGLYLWANRDPYAQLSQVPVALVVADEGALIDDTQRKLGDEVADELIADGTFEWHLVSLAGADAGLDDGSFDFAVEIPADFSAAVASLTSDAPYQAEILLHTNDANNYLASTIGAQAVAQIQQTVTEKIVSEAGLTLLDGMHEIRVGLVDAAAGAGELVDGLGSADDGALQLHSGVETLADGITQLEAGATTVAEGASQVADGTREIDDVADQVGAASFAVIDALPQARDAITAALTDAGLNQTQIDEVLSELDPVGERAEEVNTHIQAVVAEIDELDEGAHAVATGASALATGMASAAEGSDELVGGASALQDGIAQLADGALTLSDGLAAGVDEIPDSDEATREGQADALSSPVSTEQTSLTQAQNYGAGLAPFFAALAGWIGIYALFLIVKPISKRAITALHSPIRITLAGWATPALLGGLQMIGLFGVLAITLGFQFANPLGTLGILVFASATYAAIVLALNVWLGSVGQFLGLVLMVLQLVTAGGTFPWQTLPAPLAALHHVLPMGYVVDAMRQVMYGGNMERVGVDLMVLALWMVGGVLLAAIGVTRMTHFRTLRDLQPSLIG
ncbi:YhgE/Pip domain-containing protein [Microbacterium sp. NPDC076911]|uniref:YhgE/Pip domain-containing protein n=1 Tax=Microbacterium sp. NPDC076911 TaxID=3154958 RepID=UPI00342EEB12